MNRHGVNSSWMLLVGVNQILVFNLSGCCSSRESSVTQWSFNWLSSISILFGWSPFVILIQLFVCIALNTLTSSLEMETCPLSPLHPLHGIRLVISTVRCSIPPPTRRSNPNPIHPTPSTYRFGCFKPFYGNLNQLRKTTQDHLRPSETI